jgi:hypothetical protein
LVVKSGLARPGLGGSFDFYHTDIVLSDLPGLVNSLKSAGDVSSV